MTLSEISQIFTLIIAIGTAIFAWKKTKPESRNLDAQTLNSLQNTLNEAIELNQRLQGRIADVEKRTEILIAEAKAKNVLLAELEKVNSQILSENKQIILENRRLEKYVKLCIAEIQRIGGTVPTMPPLEEAPG